MIDISRSIVNNLEFTIFTLYVLLCALGPGLSCDLSNFQKLLHRGLVPRCGYSKFKFDQAFLSKSISLIVTQISTHIHKCYNYISHFVIPLLVLLNHCSTMQHIKK